MTRRLAHRVLVACVLVVQIGQKIQLRDMLGNGGNLIERAAVGAFERIRAWRKLKIRPAIGAGILALNGKRRGIGRHNC